MQPILSRRVLAIEIEHNGHHPSYIRNFAEIWAKSRIPAELKFLVTAQFLRQHAEEVEVVKSLRPFGLDIEALKAPLAESSGPRSPREYWIAWKAYCQAAKDWRADHGLLMYCDYFQVPLWLGQESPCPLTAIYFRPTFHYGQLADYHPNAKDRIKALRKRWLLKRFLRVQKLERLFSLDPLAVEYIDQNLKPKWGGRPAVEFLPDTFVRFDESPGEVERIKKDLNVAAGRKILLLLGVLDRRKGVRELLQACLDLPPESAKKLCIVLVGRLADDCKVEVLQLAEQVKQIGDIQLVVRDQFIPESEVQLYYLAADVILATYQKHLGNSSALIRAALAEKPVLVSDFGLMGEITRRRRLGRTVNSGNRRALRDGLVAVAEEHCDGWFDVQSARCYAAENTSEQLAECLKRIAAVEATVHANRGR